MYIDDNFFYYWNVCGYVKFLLSCLLKVTNPKFS